MTGLGSSSPNPSLQQALFAAHDTAVEQSRDVKVLNDLFQSEIRADGEDAWIILSGELDAATVARLQGTLSELGDLDPTRVIIDLRDLTFIDSSGVRALWRLQLESANPVVLVEGRRAVMRVLEIMGLNEILSILPRDALPPEPMAAS